MTAVFCCFVYRMFVSDSGIVDVFPTLFKCILIKADFNVLIIVIKVAILFNNLSQLDQYEK